MSRFDINKIKPKKLARGIKAGITENARYVVNTDKAFDFIGDHIGHVYFILVAIATTCYGLFMFIQGIAYDTDKD